MKPVRTIGIVNGGGDAPGLNAVIRAVVPSAINEHGMRVIGIGNGFDRPIWPEGAKGTHGRIRQRHFASRRHHSRHHRSRQSLRLQIHGERQGRPSRLLFLGHGERLPLVGVPKTIDNDLDATEVTFGFDTALVIAAEAIDGLHTTAESHHRVMLIEVMGRDAGWIALHAGIGGGAHIILVPELPFKFEAVCEAVRARGLRGMRFSLIDVAEGVKLPATDPSGKPTPAVGPGGVANSIAFTLREMLQKEIRVTVLGHVQRGGSPTPFDRILGTCFGVAATDLVAKGQFGRMVCLKAGKMASVSLDEALEKMKFIDPSSEIVHAARAVGITFGDSA
jgi:6-phosphofructokinase